MKQVLHILTRPEDPLPREIIRLQQAQPGVTVDVADLMQPNPDYTALLEKIFQADSISVW